RPAQHFRGRRRAGGGDLRLGRSARARGRRRVHSIACGLAPPLFRIIDAGAGTGNRAIEGDSRRAFGYVLRRNRVSVRRSRTIRRSSRARERRLSCRFSLRRNSSPSARRGPLSGTAGGDGTEYRLARPTGETQLTSRLNIIVAGLIGQYPIGGVTWDYIQYVLGLRDLGHDVTYLEDSDQWPYNPSENGC